MTTISKMNEPHQLVFKAENRLNKAKSDYNETQRQINELEKRRERNCGEISVAEDMLDLIKRELNP